MADFQVIFMDAGQGDCTLIVYPNDSLTLVDCGSRKSGTPAFDQILLVLGRYLPHANYTINNLVLTHPDADHFNKLETVFKKFPQLTINDVAYGCDISLYKSPAEGNYTYNFLSQHPKARSFPAFEHNATVDLNLSRAGVNVTILAANAIGQLKKNDATHKNANSIVLMVDYGPAKIFLMGDAFTETEDNILNNLQQHAQILAPGNYTDVILKMGHHGSDTSSGQKWVQTIKPTILAISSGTIIFSLKGLPTDKHLNATVANTKLRTLCPQFALNPYVVFVTDQNDQMVGKFKQMPSKCGIWATLFDAQWVGPGYKESGQTWYYGVTPKGNLYDIWMYGTGHA